MAGNEIIDDLFLKISRFPRDARPASIEKAKARKEKKRRRRLAARRAAGKTKETES